MCRDRFYEKRQSYDELYDLYRRKLELYEARVLAHGIDNIVEKPPVAPPKPRMRLIFSTAEIREKVEEGKSLVRERREALNYVLNMPVGEGSGEAELLSNGAGEALVRRESSMRHHPPHRQDSRGSRVGGGFSTTSSIAGNTPEGPTRRGASGRVRRSSQIDAAPGERRDAVARTRRSSQVMMEMFDRAAAARGEGGARTRRTSNIAIGTAGDNSKSAKMRRQRRASNFSSSQVSG